MSEETFPTSWAVDLYLPGSADPTTLAFDSIDKAEEQVKLLLTKHREQCVVELWSYCGPHESHIGTWERY